MQNKTFIFSIFILCVFFTKAQSFPEGYWKMVNEENKLPDGEFRVIQFLTHDTYTIVGHSIRKDTFKCDLFTAKIFTPKTEIALDLVFAGWDTIFVKTPTFKYVLSKMSSKDSVEFVQMDKSSFVHVDLAETNSELIASDKVGSQADYYGKYAVPFYLSNTTGGKNFPEKNYDPLYEVGLDSYCHLIKMVEQKNSVQKDRLYIYKRHQRYFKFNQFEAHLVVDKYMKMREVLIMLRQIKNIQGFTTLYFKLQAVHPTFKTGFYEFDINKKWPKSADSECFYQWVDKGMPFYEISKPIIDEIEIIEDERE